MATRSRPRLARAQLATKTRRCRPRLDEPFTWRTSPPAMRVSPHTLPASGAVTAGRLRRSRLPWHRRRRAGVPQRIPRIAMADAAGRSPRARRRRLIAHAQRASSIGAAAVSSVRATICTWEPAPGARTRRAASPSAGPSRRSSRPRPRHPRPPLLGEPPRRGGPGATDPALDRDAALHDLQRVHTHQRSNVQIQREQAGLHRGPGRRHLAQLVQAAESCQVAIIHPGKPRDPTSLACRADPARRSFSLKPFNLPRRPAVSDAAARGHPPEHTSLHSRSGRAPRPWRDRAPGRPPRRWRRPPVSCQASRWRCPC